MSGSILILETPLAPTLGPTFALRSETPCAKRLKFLIRKGGRAV
jgi:hypothetical protein